MHGCPRCPGRTLHAHPHDADAGDDDTAGALACRDCGGVWLTASAAQRALPGRFGPLAGLPAVATGFAALRCPACRRELARRRVADVDIDVCAPHGAWFDHREVERIRDAAHHSTDRPHDLPGGDAALAAGLVVAALASTQSPAPPQASGIDVGSAIEATALVADIALTSADVAATAGSGAIEVAGAIESTGGVLDALAGIFDGLFSL